jgi:hypothetical protein
MLNDSGSCVVVDDGIDHQLIFGFGFATALMTQYVGRMGGAAGAGGVQGPVAD